MLEDLANDSLNEKDIDDLFGMSDRQSIRRNQRLTEMLVKNSFKQARATISRNIQLDDDDDSDDYDDDESFER